ncbi:hypothetical protein [Streptomyces ficellus]|uniref:MarR family transcriptional regulator n=1 Tax=Streptomyces ficellus TaxID=1977088 RepID=A0A6I6F667_9ACTN|nr:hypothetical protein [Streptomyces ficellus]QGV78441.1 hypothetical protein EIZ62_09445 [Streptomyces ficellus]
MTTITEYSTGDLAAQPAGACTGLAYRAVVGALRAESPEGTFTLTAAGEAGRARARERNAVVHARTHAGIPAEEYAAAVNVLRRLIANLGGDADLP